MSLTVRIKMKTLSASPTGVMQAGVVYSVSEEEAEALVNGGYANYVDEVSDDEGNSGDDLTNEELSAQLKHIGGGTFELPDGERVKGKEEAIASLREKLAKESEK